MRSAYRASIMMKLFWKNGFLDENGRLYPEESMKKIITLCGSWRFSAQMERIAEELELEQGVLVLGITPHVLGRDLTDAEKEKLGRLHLRRIDLADAILVVNIGGYIGESTRREMDYARLQGKEILYWETVHGSIGRK